MASYNRQKLVLVSCAILTLVSRVQPYFFGSGKSNCGSTVGCMLIDNGTFSCPKAGCTEFPMDLDKTFTRRILLQGNKITALKDRIPYPELTELNLANNNINQIKQKIFEECGKLETLNLARNNISLLTTPHWSGLSNLQVLYLNDNNLHRLESVLFDFAVLGSLRRLDLSDNKITEMDHNAFTDLQGLHSLYLSKNLLTSIKENHFLGLDFLEHLDLSANQLKSIGAGTFTPLKDLRTLYLQTNKISHIAIDAFEGLNELRVLNLKHNNFDVIPPATFSLSHLSNLLLDYNQLAVISKDTFSSMKSSELEEISLSNMNRLEIIKNGSFVHLSKLTKLFMHHNPKLRKIEAGAFGKLNNSNLDVIDLSNNALESIAQDALPWTRMSSVDIRGNPWRCDCKLEWMLELYISEAHWDDVKCSSPSHLKGIKIKKVTYDQFVCNSRDYTARIMVAMSLMLAFILGTTAGILIFKHRHRVCGWYYRRPGRYVSLYDIVEQEDGAVTISYKGERAALQGEASKPVDV